MGGNKRCSSGPHPTPPVQSDSLEQVEPEYGTEFAARPISLTAEELGRRPTTMAIDLIPVRAWVSFPAMPVHVQVRALAWTPHAVYVEWQDRGLHRACVWASAVQRGGLPV